ncbi:unnamed protein product [Haemonchus placei]|uniref:Uncharacterized protein n=1 Tax=Haemonchus placei TaxID=6290 RepID=A0A3P7WZK6_HAEPC|nr:unnamed protein product [Haemonchus placei]
MGYGGQGRRSISNLAPSRHALFTVGSLIAWIALELLLIHPPSILGNCFFYQCLL